MAHLLLYVSVKLHQNLLGFLTNILRKSNSVLYLNTAFSFQVFESREHVNLWSMAFLVVTAVGVLSTPGRNKYGTEKFVKQKVHILQNRHVFYYGWRINLGMSFNRKERDTKEKYGIQEDADVVRNFLLGGVTEVPLTSCLKLDTSLKIEERLIHCPCWWQQSQICSSLDVWNVNAM